MRAATLCILACLAPQLLSGQIQFSAGMAVPNAQNQGPHHAVTGIVNNAVTGEPVRKALVQLMGQTQASTLTGPDGRFRFEDVPEGQVTFFLQKPGFFGSNAIQNSEWANQNQTFTISSEKSDFQLKLYPSAQITGQVTDTNGEPIEGAMIQMMAEQIQQGRKQWQSRNTSTTDDDGVFKMDDLTPGHYVLFSSGHVFPAIAWNAPPEVSPPIYYPDAADVSSAQTIDVQAGQEVQADLHLRAERAYRVVAQLSGAPANPGVSLSLQTPTGQIVLTNGFRFDSKQDQVVATAIPSGTWILQATIFDSQGHSQIAREEITVDHSDVNAPPLVFHQVTSIAVTVNHPAPAGSSNSAQTPPTPEERRQRVFSSANIQASLVSEHQTTYAFPFGNPPELTFRDLLPGKYKLKVQPFGNECLESATAGGVDLTRDYLVVNPDGSAPPITINMRYDCGVLKLAFKPTDHLPPTVFAVAVPDSGFAEPFVQPLALQFAGVSGFEPSLTLSPGSYQIYAFSNLNGFEYANPEVMRNYSSQRVTLEAGQKTDLTVEISEPKAN